MTKFSRPLLAKILGRMGSSAEGEVLSAARQAHIMVAGSGLSWEDVLAGRTAPGVTEGPRLPPDPPVSCAGQMLSPFNGDRWIESVLHLLGHLDRGNLAMPEQDRDFLRALPSRLSDRRIRSYEAGFLHRYRRRLDEKGIV